MTTLAVLSGSAVRQCCPAALCWRRRGRCPRVQPGSGSGSWSVAAGVVRSAYRDDGGSLTLTAGGTDTEISVARMMVTMGNKSSRDTARRVADGRERTADAGRYGGGRRPFGYRPDLDAPKYAKTLIVVESEAAEIRAAATAILAGVSPVPVQVCQGGGRGGKIHSGSPPVRRSSCPLR